MEIVYVVCCVIFTISASIALVSVSKKNFAVKRVMNMVYAHSWRVNSIFDGYEAIIGKTVEMIDKTMTMNDISN